MRDPSNQLIVVNCILGVGAGVVLSAIPLVPALLGMSGGRQLATADLVGTYRKS